MSDVTPRTPPTSSVGGVPRNGAFAISEVLPLMQQASHQLAEARDEWHQLRDVAAQSKAAAKRTRANLIVSLRVWGNEGTGSVPITTSAERNEWADADPDVQQTELQADLDQSAAMNARAVLDERQAFFSSLQGMLAIERDTFKAERGGPQ